MVRIAVGVSTAAIASVALGMGRPVDAQSTGQVQQLFDGKTFKNWYTFIPGEGRNKDSTGVFKIEDGCFHASGHKFAFISTEKDYDNYRFTVEFKWGQKKWPPRENQPRDAGILYHCVGEDKVWNKSLECQIQEGDTGDMWLTAGKDGSKPSLEVLGQRYVGGRVIKFADYEKPTGEWNTVTVVCRGARVEHWVNGKCNFVGKNASETRGRINLQSEGAEIWYRNPTIELFK
jgi:hypothetical protein